MKNILFIILTLFLCSFHNATENPKKNYAESQIKQIEKDWNDIQKTILAKNANKLKGLIEVNPNNVDAETLIRSAIWHHDLENSLKKAKFSELVKIELAGDKLYFFDATGIMADGAKSSQLFFKLIMVEIDGRLLIRGHHSSNQQINNMKTLLVTLIAGIFTFSPVETPNNSAKVNSEITAEHNDPSGDWDAILKAILNKDVKGLAKYAGNDAVDSEAIIKDAAAHSYVYEVFKSYEYKHLIKEKVNGVEYLMCKAYTVTTDANDVKTTRIFQLYMSEKDGHLTIEFYVNLNEINK